MNEADVRLIVSHALQWQGMWSFHWNDGRVIPAMCPYCKKWHSITVTPEIKGRPDLLGIHPSPPRENLFIEVKDVPANAKSFALAEISVEQSQYLDAFWANGGAAFLAIGKIVPMGSKTRILAILCVPWYLWNQRTEIYEKSIAWDWALYQRKPVVQKQSMIELFPEQKYWLGKENGHWRFHPDHPIRKMGADVELPFYLRERKEPINDDSRAVKSDTP